MRYYKGRRQRLDARCGGGSVSRREGDIGRKRGGVKSISIPTPHLGEVGVEVVGTQHARNLNELVVIVVAVEEGLPAEDHA